MYDLEYVKKQKRKKRATIIAGVSSIALTSLIIVSFLGDRVGTFTISLEHSDVKISLSDSSAFTTSSSFLRVEDLPICDLYTYDAFENDAIVDNEDSTYQVLDYGGEKIMTYFKYTFFVKNVGSVTAQYDFTVNLVYNNNDSHATHSLDDILRVRVYENKDKKHNSRIFAKQSRTTHYINNNGVMEPTSREFIAIGENNYVTGNDESEFAERFVSTDVVMTSHVKDFVSEDVMRYTVVYWLEGEDPEAVGTAPESCSIRLGVDIKAYENK